MIDLFLCAALVASPALPAPRLASERYTVELTARPESVVPGGWVELSAVVTVAEGWHTYSPRSEGAAARIAFRAPEPLLPFGAPAQPDGRWEEAPGLGRVEVLAGTFRFAQLYRVPETTPVGELVASAALSLILCDAKACLPPRETTRSAPVRVDPNGGLGPSAKQPSPTSVLVLPPEKAQLLERAGFTFRVWTDRGEVAPGDELMLTVEIIVAPGCLLSPPGGHISSADGNVRIGLPFLTVVGGGTRALDPLLPGSEEGGGGRLARRGGAFRVWLPIVVGPKLDTDRLVLKVRLQGLLEREGEPEASLATQEELFELAIVRGQ